MSENARQDRKARKMKMPTSFAILGILLLVMAILTIVVAAAGGEGVREALPLPEIAGEILAGGSGGAFLVPRYSPVKRPTRQYSARDQYPSILTEIYHLTRP